MNRQTKATQIDAAAGAAETLWRAAFLILSGGFQDAYTYVCRGGVFANAQTGNVVLMSAKLMHGEWRAAVTYLIPLAAFFTGTFAAETIRRRLEKSGRHRVNRAVLAVEIALLFCVGFLPQQENALANALVSLACAAQVQTFQTVCGYPYASTMCIGNLRSGMDHFYKAITEKRKDELKTAAIYLTAIGSFTIGAACGGHLTNHFSYRTIWISCGLLILCFLLMLIEEEDDLEAIEKEERQELKREQDELKEEKKELQKEQKELQKEQNELKEDQKIIREMDEKTQHQ